MSKSITLAIPFAVITACSNLPPHITPSVSLISSDQKVTYTPVSAEEANALSKSSTQTLSKNRKNYILGKTYFSALGVYCRKMKEQTQREQKEIFNVCQINGQWRILPSTETAVSYQSFSQN